MTKTFIYVVNGQEFYGDEPWGENWKQAVETAKAEHTYIERTVVKQTWQGEKIEYQTYLKGGVFLPDKMYTEEELKEKRYIF